MNKYKKLGEISTKNKDREFLSPHPSSNGDAAEPQT